MIDVSGVRQGEGGLGYSREMSPSPLIVGNTRTLCGMAWEGVESGNENTLWKNSSCVIEVCILGGP